MGFEPGRIRSNVVVSLCINILNEIKQDHDSTGFDVLQLSLISFNWLRRGSFQIKKSYPFSHHIDAHQALTWFDLCRWISGWESRSKYSIGTKGETKDQR